MGQITECVASSISRWHGCKAEYYLLSCSTHMRDISRMGTWRSFFEGSHSQAVAASLRLIRKALYHSHSELRLQKVELRTQARTRCEFTSQPQANPLYTRHMERHRIADTASHLYTKLNLVQCHRTILWIRGHTLAQPILLLTRTSNDMFFYVCKAWSFNFYANLLLTTTCKEKAPHPRQSERLLNKKKVT